MRLNTGISLSQPRSWRNQAWLLKKSLSRQKGLKFGDRKCLPPSRKSLISHPDAFRLLRFSQKRVFQQPQAIAQACAFVSPILRMMSVIGILQQSRRLKIALTRNRRASHDRANTHSHRHQSRRSATPPIETSSFRDRGNLSIAASATGRFLPSAASIRDDG